MMNTHQGGNTQGQRPITRVLERLEEHGCNPRRAAAGYSARCPSHEDRVASLSASENSSSEALLHCHAGCETATIVSDLGLEWSDLFPADSKDVRSKTAIIATYDYRDEIGTVLFQVVRTSPKGFRQRRPDGNGGWIWNLQNTRRVPYNLQALIDAIKRETPVFVVEGEKDCERLVREGLTATCCAGGAGKWRPEYAPFFEGAIVTVIADADDVGRKHAEAVASSLRSAARGVKVLDLFPDRSDGSDVSDYFAQGGTVDDLAKRIASIHEAEETHPVGIASTRAADIRPVRIRWLWDKRVALEMLNVFSGPGGAGKSTILYDTASRASREGASVLIATAEDHLAAIVRPRLEAAGADLSKVHVVTDDMVIPEDLDRLEERARQLGVALITIDPLVAFLAGDINTHKDSSVRQALKPLAKMAERVGCAVAVVIHTNKSPSDDPLFRISGSGGFSAAARHVLLACPDPEDEGGNRRVLAVVKSNLIDFPPPLAYHLEGTTIPDPETGEAIATSRVVWGEELEGFDPRILLRPPPDEEERSSQDDAADFLRQTGILEAARPAAELIREGERLGFHRKTLQRARRSLGIKSWKRDMGPDWMWGPKESEVDTPEVDTLTPVQLSSSARPAETILSPPEVDSGQELEAPVHMEVLGNGIASKEPSRVVAMDTSTVDASTLSTVARTGKTAPESPTVDKVTEIENGVHSVHSDDLALANVIAAFPGSEAVTQ